MEHRLVTCWYRRAWHGLAPANRTGRCSWHAVYCIYTVSDRRKPTALSLISSRVQRPHRRLWTPPSLPIPFNRFSDKFSSRQTCTPISVRSHGAGTGVSAYRSLPAFRTQEIGYVVKLSGRCCDSRNSRTLISSARQQCARLSQAEINV